MTTTTTTPAPRSVSDCHIATLREQLSQANDEIYALRQENEALRTQMTDRLNEKSRIISILLNHLGPYVGPLTRVGGR